LFGCIIGGLGWRYQRADRLTTFRTGVEMKLEVGAEDDIGAIIDTEVMRLYEHVIYTCNKILRQAKIFGFHFMNVPDPNIHEMVQVLEHLIVPVLDNLCDSGNFSPESGIKVANIKQYTQHIREIATALDKEDRDRFYAGVATLDKEAMLL
jgi:hypothetical protein